MPSAVLATTTYTPLLRPVSITHEKKKYARDDIRYSFSGMKVRLTFDPGYVKVVPSGRVGLFQDQFGDGPDFVIASP